MMAKLLVVVILLFLTLFQLSQVFGIEICRSSIKAKIAEFANMIKPPTFQTSISQPVCSRTFSKDVRAKVNELKSILQNNKQSQRCSTSLTRNSQEKSLSTSCNINNMTDEEKDARTDLQPAGINIEHICVKKDGPCDTPGSIDANTCTINMCRTCKFLVYLPSDYFPQSLLHFQCGNGANLSCLTREGACKKRQLRYHIVNISNGSTAVVTVTTGCACEVLKGSVLQVLV